MHLFCPMSNHMFAKIFLCFYFRISISKKIFRQPSMFCLSHDLQGKKKSQQGVHLLPRIGMSSFWPDICHSQIHTKNELPHSAHRERHCSTQGVMGTLGDSAAHRTARHLYRGQKFAFNANCTGHWRQSFCLKDMPTLVSCSFLQEY